MFTYDRCPGSDEMANASLVSGSMILSFTFFDEYGFSNQADLGVEAVEVWVLYLLFSFF